MNNNKILFIHSLFRTGSTFIWNVFRKNKQFCCYYEPFNKELSTLSNTSNVSNQHAITKKMNHPDIEKDYFHEYRQLLKQDIQGVPYFNESFIFEDFCCIKKNTAQKKYIDFLTSSVRNNTDALFQFNRSALRIQWFKKQYPYSLNFYLVRNPRHQWESYLFCLNTISNYFILNDFMSINKNVDSFFFHPLKTTMPLYNLKISNTNKLVLFYHYYISTFSIQERYFLFYYLWLIGLLENIQYSNFIVNIDLLSKNRNYCQNISQKINKYSGFSVDFTHACIQEYTKTTLKKEEMNTIEEKVQILLIKHFGKENISQIVQKVEDYELNYLGFDKNKIVGTNIKDENIQKNFVCRETKKRIDSSIEKLLTNSLKDKINLHEKDKQIAVLLQFVDVAKKEFSKGNTFFPRR